MHRAMTMHEEAGWSNLRERARDTAMPAQVWSHMLKPKPTMMQQSETWSKQIRKEREACTDDTKELSKVTVM